MDNIEIVKLLLGFIGADKEKDKALADACLVLLGEPKEEPKAEPKAETKRGRKPFDMGKLKALLDGGWSVPKIADEMGVSDQTIYNKMKKLEADA